MIRHRSSSRERMPIRVSAEDHMHLERMREILLAEPNRGIPTEPHQLLEHVYIGNQSNAESLRLLRRLGITHVLNCAGYKGPRKHPEVSPYEGLGIEYYEFKAEDHDFYDIVKHFHEAFSFLDKVHRRGGKALVHCAMGINRSGATCVGYMMQHKNWSLDRVTRMIKNKRRVVLSNKGFQLQLVRFARKIGCLGKLELPTSRTRESRSREIHHTPRRANDLPPSGLPPSHKYHIPRSRRQETTYTSSYQNPRAVITTSNPYSYTVGDYRRNSFNGERNSDNQRPDASLDILSMCINNTLNIGGSRSNSAGRYRASQRSY